MPLLAADVRQTLDRSTIGPQFETQRFLSQSICGYVIAAGPYAINSAGIHCLHRLCDELNRIGFPSFVSVIDPLTAADPSQQAPGMNAPLINWKTAEALCRAGYTAVYPEIVAGNPLKARTVARWVLNRPGLLGGEKIYADSEQVFSYSNLFLPYIKNQVAGRLHMPNINQELFFCDPQDCSPRSLDCYYIGKSKWKDGVCDPARTFEITRTTPPKSELGKLFRSTRVLYCFDNCTALAYEALFCGCKVVIVPDGTQSKENYEQFELGMEGIAWGQDELAQVRLDLSAISARYARLKDDFQSQLQRFIEITRPDNFKNSRPRSRTSKPTESWQKRTLQAWKQGFKKIKAKGRQVKKRIRDWKSGIVHGRLALLAKENLQTMAIRFWPPSEQGFVLAAPAPSRNPEDFEHLKQLCAELSRRGVPSRLTCPEIPLSRNAALIGVKGAMALCERGYTAIYPDSIAGNPLNARRVVRWVLNRPGTRGGAISYDASEHLFYSSEVLRPYINFALAAKLFTPPIDESHTTYEQLQPSQRALECFYLGKSHWREGIFDRSRVFEITWQSPAKKELGKLLGVSKRLYTFDSSTDLIDQALLCGCKVVMVPDGSLMKADFQRLEIGSNGLAWNRDESEHSEVDLPAIRQRYELQRLEFESQIQRLIAVRHTVD